MNPHSNLASLYRYFYMTENLPNNLCNYFWGLIFAFVCLPFTWLAIIHNRIFNPIQKKIYNDRYYYSTPFKPIPTIIGLVFTILTFIIGAIALSLSLTLFNIDIHSVTWINRENHLIGVLQLYSIGLVTIFSSIILFNLVIGVWRLIPKKQPKAETQEEYQARIMQEYDKLTKRQEYKRNNPSFLTLTWRWLKAFKEKNCPIITWDYSKEN